MMELIYWYLGIGFVIALVIFLKEAHVTRNNWPVVPVYFVVITLTWPFWAILIIIVSN